MYMIAATGGFSLVCWFVFYFMFRKDRSRYRNCYLLSFALFSLLLFVINVTGLCSEAVAQVMVYMILLVVLIVPLLLILSGIRMIRKESRRFAHLLSFLLGIVILAGQAVTLSGIFRYLFADDGQPLIPRTFPAVSGAVFSVTVIYGSASFLMYVIYTLFLQIIPRRKDFDYVIILGAGLLGGNRVSRLLQERLDKGAEVYRQDPTPPVLIPSGGKGPDETVSEAEAMKSYLIARGIPEEDIITENRSASTRENLLFSKQILDGREGRKYTALVSSNYHVYRALRCSREAGLKCTGIGSPVALYYWPNALIREYIAVHAEKKHTVMFFAGWFLCVAALLASVFG